MNCGSFATASCHGSRSDSQRYCAKVITGPTGLQSFASDCSDLCGKVKVTAGQAEAIQVHVDPALDLGLDLISPLSLHCAHHIRAFS